MNENSSDNTVKITIIKNGPALLQCSEAQITHTNGEKEIKQKNVSICRCAISKNQPFCDGAHRACKFEK